MFLRLRMTVPLLLMLIAGQYALAAADSNLRIELLARPATPPVEEKSAKESPAKQSPAKENQAEAAPLMAGEAVRIGVNVSGNYDFGAVSGLHPGAWIRPRLKNRKSCKDAVRNYLTVGPNAARDIDLNSYSFVTLNEDNSVAVMDPRLNLASANLLALQKFDQPVTDWHLNSATGEIFLGLANGEQSAGGRLAIVHALNSELIAELPLPARPTKIVASDKDRVLWIAGPKALMLVDTKSRQLVKTIALKSSDVQLAVSSEREQLWAYSQQDGELIALDTVSQELLWRRQLPAGLTSMSYSAYADSLYFGSRDQKKVSTLYPEADSKIQTIAVSGMPDAVSVSPNGQWLFALDTAQKQILIIDPATHQTAHHLLFEHAFDQLIFSSQYAYVHHTTSPRVSLILLDTLTDATTPSVIEVPFGVTAPGKQVSALPLIQPLPEGGAVIVANPADKTLFLYMEDGMLAPANAFKVYTAAPRTLLIHDKSLTETLPGRYETVTMVPRPGEYELVFYLTNPLTVSCLPLTVAGNEAGVATLFESKVSAIQLAPASYTAGIPAQVKVRLTTAAVDKAADVNLLLFKPGSNWQRRIRARPDHSMQVTATVTFPEVGKYLLGVQSSKLNMRLEQTHMQTIEVTP